MKITARAACHLCRVVATRLTRLMRGWDSLASYVWLEHALACSSASLMPWFFFFFFFLHT